jgi:hypothetical protein
MFGLPKIEKSAVKEPLQPGDVYILGISGDVPSHLTISSSSTGNDVCQQCKSLYNKLDIQT